MNSDFKDLLHLFNAKSVKYLIVGGYFVSKADLIASKQAAGRPKDLADLAALTHDNEG